MSSQVGAGTMPITPNRFGDTPITVHVPSDLSCATIVVHLVRDRGHYGFSYRVIPNDDKRA